MAVSHAFRALGTSFAPGLALLYGQAHGAEAVGTPGLFVAGMIAASALFHAAGYGVGIRLAAAGLAAF